MATGRLGSGSARPFRFSAGAMGPAGGRDAAGDLPSPLDSFLTQLRGSPFWCRPPMLLLLWSSAISQAALRCPGATPEAGTPGPGRCLLCAAASFSILLPREVFGKKRDAGSPATVRWRAWLPTSSESLPSVARGPRCQVAPVTSPHCQRSEVSRRSPARGCLLPRPAAALSSADAPHSWGGWSASGLR